MHLNTGQRNLAFSPTWIGWCSCFYMNLDQCQLSFWHTVLLSHCFTIWMISFFIYESSCRSGPVGNSENGPPIGDSELYPRRPNATDSPFPRTLVLYGCFSDILMIYWWSWDIGAHLLWFYHSCGAGISKPFGVRAISKAWGGERRWGAGCSWAQRREKTLCPFHLHPALHSDRS